MKRLALALCAIAFVGCGTPPAEDEDIVIESPDEKADSIVGKLLHLTRGEVDIASPANVASEYIGRDATGAVSVTAMDATHVSLLADLAATTDVSAYNVVVLTVPDVLTTATAAQLLRIHGYTETPGWAPFNKLITCDHRNLFSKHVIIDRTNGIITDIGSDGRRFTFAQCGMPSVHSIDVITSTPVPLADWLGLETVRSYNWAIHMVVD